VSAPQERVKCPWCDTPVLTDMERSGLLPFHREPAERWTGGAPECVASGMRFCTAEALAAIRREGGDRLRLAAHP
jgi:hypothetical protein